MRTLTPNPLVLPRLASPKPTGRSCLLNKSDDDVSRASQIRGLYAGLFPQPRLHPPSTSALSNVHRCPYPDFPPTAQLLSALRHGFNTHSPAVGPRFSTTDF
jgi:hypothetical protein